MRNLTCIVCPIGCSLVAGEAEPGADGLPVLTITGNRCPRGAAYAQEEIRAPKRIVTATCAIAEDSAPAGAGCSAASAGAGPRRVPVKTSAPCPREKVSALLKDIYQTNVKLPVRAGDKILSNWDGLGIDVLAVRNLG
ncbi:MAG: DUF1667 domain-containing protein [Treponema sp.]|jgi:CxxC motif-containing protein|nr:DUF1667 domain-containing protein [Treponema sp.]